MSGSNREAFADRPWRNILMKVARKSMTGTFTFMFMFMFMFTPRKTKKGSMPLAVIAGLRWYARQDWNFNFNLNLEKSPSVYIQYLNLCIVQSR